MWFTLLAMPIWHRVSLLIFFSYFCHKFFTYINSTHKFGSFIIDSVGFHLCWHQKIPQLMQLGNQFHLLLAARLRIVIYIRSRNRVWIWLLKFTHAKLTHLGISDDFLFSRKNHRSKNKNSYLYHRVSGEKVNWISLVFVSKFGKFHCVNSKSQLHKHFAWFLFFSFQWILVVFASWQHFHQEKKKWNCS